MMVNGRRETPLSDYQKGVLARLERDRIRLEEGYMARWPNGEAVRMDAVEKLKRWGLIESRDGEILLTGIGPQ